MIFSQRVHLAIEKNLSIFQWKSVGVNPQPQKQKKKNTVIRENIFDFDPVCHS